MTRGSWTVKINQVWNENDQPLQVVMKKKMQRQETEFRQSVEEMDKADRILRVQDLRLRFASRRMENDMVRLEDMMSALDITIFREGTTGYQAMSQEYQEDMDWKVVELHEHALLDQWQMELGIGVLDDEDWKMMDIELEHGYLDRLIDMMEQNDDDNGQDSSRDGVVVSDDVMNVSLAVWEHQPQNSQQLLMPINRLVFGLKDRDEELSQALRYPVCVSEEKRLQSGTVPTNTVTKNYSYNIVGVKGMEGSRKRKKRYMSGGWQAGRQESGRSPWRHPRRRIPTSAVGKPIM